jgi:hypothetical protein
MIFSPAVPAHYHSLDESVEKGLSFMPSIGDIFVATHSKAGFLFAFFRMCTFYKRTKNTNSIGTTIVQQIVHQLRTNGSMDFEEINQVCPWVEPAFDLQQDLSAAQVASPRVFKTHCGWIDVPKLFGDNEKKNDCITKPSDDIVAAKLDDDDDDDDNLQLQSHRQLLSKYIYVIRDPHDLIISFYSVLLVCASIFRFLHQIFSLVSVGLVFRFKRSSIM